MLITFILQKTGELFAGPLARHMVYEHFEGTQSIDLMTWQVFLLGIFKETLILKKNMSILHQVK